MKIWTLATDTDYGTNATVEFTEEGANQAGLEILASWWPDDVEMPDFPTWKEAMEALGDLGCIDTLMIEEHDISDHPFVLAVENLLDREDIFVSSEVGDAIMTITNGDYSVPAEEQINCLSCGEPTTTSESPPDCYDREHG